VDHGPECGRRYILVVFLLSKGVKTLMSEQVEYRDLAPFGFVGYRVGNDGSVWSCRTIGRRATVGLIWRRLQFSKPGTHGYFTARIRHSERGKITVCVHKLILLGFSGEPREDQECRHLDGNRTNNRKENLSWGTHLENVGDTVRHGRASGGVFHGQDHPNSTLTEDAAYGIIAAYNMAKAGQAKAPRGTLTSIADRFATSKQNVCFIVTGRSWKHLKRG
jgi:hypothetical protein